MRLLIVTAMAVGLAASPVLAQTKAPSTTPAPSGTQVPAKSAADCEANWKTADKNSDGRLDTAEISDAKAMIPTTISSNSTINQQDFLSACRTTVQSDKK